MKSSIRAVLLFVLLGLVAGLAIPEQFSTVEFSGKEACHPILSSCRAAVDCCAGLRCATFDGEALCVPGGD
ncbi:857d92f3-c01a-490f-a144-7ccef4b39547 [Thermothielavioides terrestris]|uniref:Uncharacterized protein n=2 Tax=Thermothielavioides terrestris TaxID=2587410 RepID=G2QZI6_THETT|nr:uncharacterized protein THITE_2047936 [Thermothielavioides terrestris NRRL 8126]AEO65512.1 hypothetical protein THITE_2047936 [Thermothielavioides terrestris NRRL 8126]SPQ19235.1 857d92f3-c01a-490f-a144-7ccef4b39547 [Thermothielavioides terrestris]